MEFASKVRTCLWFREAAGMAAEFYTSLLPDSRIETVYRPDPDGPPLVVEFTLAGVPFMSMNMNPGEPFSPACSVSVLTADQRETDVLWEALLADGGEESMCGWLKDRYGVSWQIVPETLPRLLHAGDPDQAQRVSAALMQMRKIDITALEAAAAGQER